MLLSTVVVLLFLLRVGGEGPADPVEDGYRQSRPELPEPHQDGDDDNRNQEHNLEQEKEGDQDEVDLALYQEPVYQAHCNNPTSLNSPYSPYPSF